ncbi:MAG: PEGA domain-containing protein [Treponema sp.]|nr:PEGA domain-containing protein [Treponema sp.]
MKKRIRLFCILICSLFIAPSAFAANVGYFNITSNVYGALIYIDGRLVGTTPYTATVTSSVTHSIKITKYGYYDYTNSAWIAAGHTMNIHAYMEALPTTGTVVVKANISGASVYLDGSYKGTTPLTINNVSPGNHYVRVSKNNYNDQTGSFYLSAGTTYTLTATFVGADVKVDANVYGAEVYLDSVYKGTTPLTLRDIEPGYHTIKVTKKHYSVYSKYEKFDANYEYTRYATLEKISGYLNLSTTPSSAIAFCDGSSISKYNEEIDEGSHLIKTRAFGYYDKSEYVTIRRNQTTYHSMTMDKCPFKITSFSVNHESFNPNNSKRLNSVTYKISVTAPEEGNLVIKDASGKTVATWKGNFTTWDTKVDWDGKIDGSPVDEGIYTATITAGGYSETVTVTVDKSIKNYAQRARSSGIFFDIGSVSGPFYKGTDIGISTFFGGKHIYGGLAIDALITHFEGDYKNSTKTDGFYFWDLEFMLGGSFNWHMLRPYTHFGLGYYNCTIDSDSKVDSPSGLVLSWTVGADIVFDHFMIGGYYKLRKMDGCGYTDSFGVCFGWAFDTHD